MLAAELTLPRTERFRDFTFRLSTELRAAIESSAMQPEPSKPVKALLRHRRRPQELSGTELQELDADGLQRGRSRELGGRAGHKTKDEDGESKEKGRGKEEDGDSDSTTDSEDFAGPASPGEETGELEDTGSSSGSRSSLPTPPRPPGLIPTLKHFWTHHINILIQDPTLQRDFLGPSPSPPKTQTNPSQPSNAPTSPTSVPPPPSPNPPSSSSNSSSSAPKSPIPVLTPTVSSLSILSVVRLRLWCCVRGWVFSGWGLGGILGGRGRLGGGARLRGGAGLRGFGRGVLGWWECCFWWFVWLLLEGIIGERKWRMEMDGSGLCNRVEVVMAWGV